VIPTVSGVSATQQMEVFQQPHCLKYLINQPIILMDLGLAKKHESAAD
jgi:hypothetical protein